MQQQRVSILIAAWNGSRYLPSCLEAVRRQTYPHIELIVWDNASTDTTATIVATRTPAATLIRNDTNIGMWPAMECMLEHVTGQYVLCLSADVILSDTFVEQAVQVFESDVSIDALQPKLYQYTLGDQQRESQSASQLQIF
jgi:GT2 family glycosyltransferase